MANEFKVRKGLIVQGSGSNIFDVQGSQGQLFSVTDSLSGSLFSVNDISGIPIMEVFSDNTIKLGTFNQEAIIVSGSRTGMGLATPQAKLHISGASNSGLFEIDSPAVNNIIYVSGSGNVGIGTGTPTNTLQVSGSLWTTTITASSLPNVSQPNIIGYDTASGRFTYFSTSSFVGGSGTANYITRWSGPNTITTSSIYESGSRIGIGTGAVLPNAVLHISGANNDSLFRIQSPASASIMFVSGSGLVGIGTLTPTQKISVDNGNVGFTSGFGISWDSDTEWIRRAAASDQLQLATQNTVRLNIGSTQGQLVTIGLGATTGTAQFQVRGGGATAATTAMRIEDSGGNARLTILDDGTSAFNTSHLYISSSGNVGIGLTAMTAKLHVSGASNAGLLEIDSVANNNILFVSGSGRVGIGTGTPNATLQIAGTLNNGLDSAPSGAYSHTEGQQTQASGDYSHAEGGNTTAVGYASHAEGNGTNASGSYSHAEGWGTTAVGYASHAEGINTLTSGNYSHTEGYGTIVELPPNIDGAAHAEGWGTIANASFQHVEGQWNTSSADLQSSFIIGSGTGGNDRRNLVVIRPTNKISDFFGPVRITRTEETSTQDPDTLRDQNKAGIIYMGFKYLFNTPNRGPSPPIAVKINNTATGGTNYGKLRHPTPTTGTTSYYTKISHTSTNAVGTSIQSGNTTLSDKYEVINTGIFTDGAVTAQEFRALGSFAVTSTSDIRLKENIKDVDINTALKLIENVKPVTFNWKRPVVGDNTDTINGKYDVGVIAQDVLKNGFEHLVRIAENTLVPEHIDDEGYVSKEGYEFGVSYVGMIPYHAKVIKYLLDEIRELKSQIKALDDK